MKLTELVFIVCAGFPASCSAPSRSAEVTDPAKQAELEAAVTSARAAFELDPADEDRAVWLGRRLAYGGHFEEAVGVYTRGLEIHPQSAQLLRHRGHRFLTLGQFAAARDDLVRAWAIAREAADVVEQDGQPNSAGKPRGTLKSSIVYHLGLAHYLLGEFELAAQVYLAGLEIAHSNDDKLVSHTYWTWLTLRRLGRDAEAAALLAPIRADMDVLENHGYQLLLLHFRGERTEEELLVNATPDSTEFASRGYGCAMKRWFDGDRSRARALLERVAAGGKKHAFGHIAAETELDRLL